MLVLLIWSSNMLLSSVARDEMCRVREGGRCSIGRGRLRVAARLPVEVSRVRSRPVPRAHNHPISSRAVRCLSYIPTLLPE